MADYKPKLQAVINTIHCLIHRTGRASRTSVKCDNPHDPQHNNINNLLKTFLLELENQPAFALSLPKFPQT